MEHLSCVFPLSIFFNFSHDIYPTLEDRTLISNFNFVF